MSGSVGLPSSTSPALTFETLAQCGCARTARMTLPHFVCETPMFMPVGTQGSYIIHSNYRKPEEVDFYGFGM